MGTEKSSLESGGFEPFIFGSATANHRASSALQRRASGIKIVDPCSPLPFAIFVICAHVE